MLYIERVRVVLIKKKRVRVVVIPTPSDQMEVKSEYKKGLWSVEEDRILMDYITKHGKGKWNRIPKLTGLKRCGKSCRLRWINYLSPAVKRGGFSDQENDLIVRLHNLLGNRWSLIAGRVPGRTDNQVKNHWNTHLSKKMGIKNKQHGAISLPRDPIPRCKNIGDNNNNNNNNNNISASGGMMMITTDDEFWHNDLNFNLPITPTTTGNVMELLDDDLSLDFLWHGL